MRPSIWILSCLALPAACGKLVDPSPALDSCKSVACPSGHGSYSYCVSADFAVCSYRVSDGTVFKCASCGDCAAAAAHASARCGGSPSGGTPPADPCGACVETARSTGCAVQVKACLGDPRCGSLAGCVSGCGSDEACASRCQGAAPATASDELDAVGQCIYDACGATCGNASPDGGGAPIDHGGPGGGDDGGAADPAPVDPGGDDGGAPAPPPPGDSCNACVEGASAAACAQPAAICQADPQCVALAKCLDACADGNCADQCYAAAPQQAGDEIDAFEQCLCDSCSAQCPGQC